MSLSTGLLSAGFAYFQGIEKWQYYGLFALFATFAVYNGQRLIKSAQLVQTPWLTWVKKHEKVLYLAVFSSALLAVSALFLIGKITLPAVVAIVVGGVISCFYIVRIRGVNMREVAYLKIHLIALTWSIILIVFPLLNENRWNNAVVWAGMAHYAYIVAVTIPFDIRDLKYDRVGQKTIPQVAGVLASKLIAIGLLLAFMAIMIGEFNGLILNPWFYLAIGAQFVLIIFMTENRGDLYCAGLIDGMIALLGFAYLMT